MLFCFSVLIVTNAKLSYDAQGHHAIEYFQGTAFQVRESSVHYDELFFLQKEDVKIQC